MKNLFGFLFSMFVFTFLMHERVSTGEGLSLGLVLLGVVSFLSVLFFAYKFYEKL